MAHPDDETVFGWPILQSKRVSKELLVVVSDANNPKREKINKRKFVLQDICRSLEIPLICLDYNSAFYRDQNQLGVLYKLIKTELQNRSYDFVFTHNYHGEYGHLDHRILFDIVYNYSIKPILFTDIIQESAFSTINEIPEREKRVFYQKKISEWEIDRDLVNFCKDYYAINNLYGQNCWTWKQPIVDSCGLFLFE